MRLVRIKKADIEKHYNAFYSDNETAIKREYDENESREKYRQRFITIEKDAFYIAVLDNAEPIGFLKAIRDGKDVYIQTAMLLQKDGNKSWFFSPEYLQLEAAFLWRLGIRRKIVCLRNRAQRLLRFETAHDNSGVYNFIEQYENITDGTTNCVFRVLHNES